MTRVIDSRSPSTLEGRTSFCRATQTSRREAATKDGITKGMAKSIKPDKEYEFGVTFEVKLTKP